MWRSLWKRLTNDRARAHRPRRSVSCSFQVEGLEGAWTPAVLRPAIIDYAVGSIPLENVFVETNEGLYLKTWNGFQVAEPR